MTKSAIFMIIVCIGIILLFLLCCAAGTKRQEYLDQHCTKIGEISDDIGFGVGFKGDLTPVFIPGKTGYKCDDGLTYWE